MTLKRILDYVERYASKSTLQGEYEAVPADNKPFIVGLLKNRMSLYYPTCTIDNNTQKLDFRLSKSYNLDGDNATEYTVKITMSDDFIEYFTEHYPEGLI